MRKASETGPMHENFSKRTEFRKKAEKSCSLALPEAIN